MIRFVAARWQWEELNKAPNKVGASVVINQLDSDSSPIKYSFSSSLIQFLVYLVPLCVKTVLHS